ncbi:sulfotransferase family protein [Azospirillum sp. B510]|uniref:sulfotransferase family protein n=1 Tax=Azospirillum sp. (strain B510) TaxID=137722 RepID=UPI00030850CA|nr:sulfotransferase family protein [Azospirillum sp. B510]
MSLPLEPDGKYQTRPLLLGQLACDVVGALSAVFRRIPPEEFPDLHCAWGRARVGSTALANLFGMVGLPAYYQPVKAVLRNALTGTRPDSWTPRSGDGPLFIKDVAGPYLIAECLYVPLEILLQAGYPADRLHLIILDRDPVQSLASWLEKWSERVSHDRLLGNFILATLNVIRVEACARRCGVPVTHYVHEASRRPVVAAEALFRHLGLGDRFTATAVTDWRTIDALDGETSQVIFPDEPDVYHVPGLHKTEPEYRYRHRDTQGLTDADLDLLDRFSLPELYRSSVSHCAQDLGLSWVGAERAEPACVH